MNISDFDYHLPPEYIAQVPIEPRDSSRMMVIDRAYASIDHSHFYDLPGMLKENDMLVFNDSRVIPARIFCKMKNRTATFELLLLRRIEPALWECMVRPGRKIMPGNVLYPVQRDGQPCSGEIEILETREGGLRTVKLSDERIIEESGNVPLPPYIHTPLEQAERYQTVYSRIKGSVAAPTAGLHFTPELLHKLTSRGIKTAFVTLHIGLDTFRPIKEEDPAKHIIHTEYGEVSEQTAVTLNQTRKEKGRIIAVGTSTIRLIEAASRDGITYPMRDQVNLFIMPGYSFRVTDAIITNFHLPRSTLLLLVSAFTGKELLFDAYNEAIREHYRFYSFGDCMFIH